MKTTLDLPDSLLAEAKAIARERRLTLRQLMEEGLRTAIERHREAAQPFRLRDTSWPMGEMLIDSWPAIRAEIYKGRGE